MPPGWSCRHRWMKRSEKQEPSSVTHSGMRQKKKEYGGKIEEKKTNSNFIWWRFERPNWTGLLPVSHHGTKDFLSGFVRHYAMVIPE